MKKVMLVNYTRDEECRIAIVSDGKLEELFAERESASSHVGNVYKGRISNVEPSIQAAFVDFGLEKNGFLHISDVHPQYFGRKNGENIKENVGQKTSRKERPPIQHCLRRGQEVIVQLTKEGIGNKGPTLTTYISIPGRYLVMMPGMSKLGISRKIEDEEARKRLREVVSELQLPPDIGFIVRTAGIDRTKRELQRDLNYLKRLWKVVIQRQNSCKAPAELYQESDLVTRTIRDTFNTDIDKIIIDDEEIASKAKEFLGIVMPRSQDRIEHYTGRIPLFHYFDIEEQILQINSKRVDLASGGFLVIDQAEALIAIDVNSGKFRQPLDAEQTALQINLEAAEEICRQLRLRDMGGVVVNDFIDMRMDRNKRAVERKMRDGLKDDRAKTKVLKMSAFGLLELTRQRMGPSREKSIYRDCSHCHGVGIVKTPESVSLDAVRTIQLALYQDNVAVIEVTVPPDVFEHLHNRRKRSLIHLEEESGKKIRLLVGNHVHPDAIELRCLDSKNHEVALAPSPTKKQTFAEKLGEKTSKGKFDHKKQKSHPPLHAQHPKDEAAGENDKAQSVDENKKQEKTEASEDRGKRGRRRRRKQFTKTTKQDHRDRRDQTDQREQDDRRDRRGGQDHRDQNVEREKTDTREQGDNRKQADRRDHRNYYDRRKDVERREKIDERDGREQSFDRPPVDDRKQGHKPEVDARLERVASGEQIDRHEKADRQVAADVQDNRVPVEQVAKVEHDEKVVPVVAEVSVAEAPKEKVESVEAPVKKVKAVRKRKKKVKASTKVTAKDEDAVAQPEETAKAEAKAKTKVKKKAKSKTKVKKTKKKKAAKVAEPASKEADISANESA